MKPKFVLLPLCLAVLLYSCTQENKSELVNSTKPSSKKQVEEEIGQVAGATSNTPATIVYCGQTSVPLMAGQTINVGSITVGNDAVNLYVTYAVNAGYTLQKTHLYVGTLAGLPTSGGGNAVPGQFPYKTTHIADIDMYTYTIPLASLPNAGGCNVIAAHSEVVSRNEFGDLVFSETGWGQGTRIRPNGGSWAMYFTWCNATCGGGVDPEK
ncbi:MAG TPA: hypothetical protein VLJ68_13785 [Chitinophagaceae bacterium]|nr:hypothetical protein [Chitinophagaceae bacterium]